MSELPDRADPDFARERRIAARARAYQRETTLRHAAEWLSTLGRDDLAVALVRELSVKPASDDQEAD